MPKKILVVDDDETTVKLVEKLLLSAAFHVITAKDGLEALVKIKKEKPDLLVLDIMMPEVNGYDVCYHLRFNKEFDKLPIVILTSRSQEMPDSIGQRINIEYVAKPVNTKTLLKKIRSLLGQGEHKPSKTKSVIPPEKSKTS